MAGGGNDESSASKRYTTFIMVGVLLSGALNNISIKQQDQYNETPARKWMHPILQTFIMFIAEFLCLIAFYILKKFSTAFQQDYQKQLSEAERKGLRIEVHPLIPYIPACCDMVGSTLQFISINLINQSIYMMLRGGTPIVTAALSVAFLGRKLYSHHYVGLSLTVVGIGVVGLSEYLQDTSGGSNMVLGLICVIGSLCTTGVQFIIEEKILNSFYILPIKMVGMEGVWGLFLAGAAILVTSFLPCSYEAGVDDTNAMCQPNGYVEDPSLGFQTLFTHYQMIIYCILAIASLSFFNFFGVSVTKYVSSLARSLLIITVTVIIWIWDILVEGEDFNWVQLIGFVVLVFGNSVYQEVIELPGLNKNTKKNLQKLSLCRDPMTDSVIKFDENLNSPSKETPTPDN
jgi:drug/metabolite transporter (DMT)-like permease